jgi:N-acetylglutamate synthase-like GNAT family acetyltransferase
MPFDNPLFIPKLIKLAEEVPNTPLDKLKRFMFLTLNQPNTKSYMDMHDGVIRGFIYASIEEFEGDRCVFIQFCVLKPCQEDKYIGFELLTKMKLWAKENKITQIYFSTARNPEAFIRKYHFEFYSTILKLDLTKEK